MNTMVCRMLMAVLWVLPSVAIGQLPGAGSTQSDATAPSTPPKSGKTDTTATVTERTDDIGTKEAGSLTPQDKAAKERESDEAEEVEELDVSGAEVELSRYGTTYANADRFFNVPLARTGRAGHFVFSIDHRAFSPITENPWFDFFGFDGGALKIGLGLRYGVFDTLDVGVHRLNGTAETFDTYQFDARYQLLTQKRFHVDVAVRAGLSWYVQENRDDAAGFFGQLLLDRIIADRLIVGASLMVHSDSSNDRKTEEDTSYSMAGALGIEYRLLTWLAADFELAQTLAGYGSDYPCFAAGVKLYTNQHTFSMLVSNTQYIGADGMVANTWRGEPNDWIIGFTITREL